MTEKSQNVDFCTLTSEMNELKWWFFKQLLMQESDFNHVGIFKRVPRWDEYINMLGDCVQN